MCIRDRGSGVSTAGLAATKYGIDINKSGFELSLIHILPELLETENGLRRAAGREELEQAPLLGSLEEQIPYDERLLRGALPYGLAAKLVYDDGDMGKVGYFQQLYVNAVNSFAQLIPEQVVDVY